MKKSIQFLAFILISISGFAQSAMISPATGNPGDVLPVSFTGISTNFVQGSTSVHFFKASSPTNFLQASSVFVLSATFMGSILSISPLAQIGSYTFKIVTPTGIVPGSNTFDIGTGGGGGQLNSVTPNQGLQGQALTVSITGTNTNFKQGSNTIVFTQGSSTNGVEVVSASAISNTNIIANLFIQASASLGMYTLNLYNLIDGILTLTDAFEVAPTAVNEVQANNTSIYPNPATDRLYFNSKHELKEVSIFDLTGKSLCSHRFENGLKAESIDLSSLGIQKQIVLVRVETTSGMSFHKLFVR